MSRLDWSIVIIYCVAIVTIGLFMQRRASRNVESYFVGGRKLPWWIIGLGSVAQYGADPISVVWIFFLGGFMELWLVSDVTWCIWMPLVTVIWAKMWRRVGVVTSAEFIEIRYGGKFAGIYRALYGMYAYFVWAVVSMAYNGAIFVQVVRPFLAWGPVKILLIFGCVVVFYTAIAGLDGVVYSDLLQVSLIFAGAFILMFILVSKVGGFSELYTLLPHARGPEYFKPFPPGGKIGIVTLIVLAIQGFFFAGHPFAGEGATAQKFMAAKDERNAVLGQMFNMILSLVVRLIPALFIALAITVLYPPESVVYPPGLWSRAVKDFAPTGILGFLFAGAVASQMANVASKLNWGSSYFINDVYKRHIRPGRKSSEYILVSRLVTVATLAFAYGCALAIDTRYIEPWLLFINSTVVVFSLPLSWLKWFWWRMNVYGDAVGVLAGIFVGAFVWFGSDAIIPAKVRTLVNGATGLNLSGAIPRFGDTSKYPFWMGFLIIFLLGWGIILAATLLTRPEDEQLLMKFYEKVRPMGVWGPIAKRFPQSLRRGILDEARRDLVACAAGIVFSFSLVISFFAFYARWYKVSVSAAPVFLVGGFWFYKLTMNAHRVK